MPTATDDLTKTRATTDTYRTKRSQERRPAMHQRRAPVRSHLVCYAERNRMKVEVLTVASSSVAGCVLVLSIFFHRDCELPSQRQVPLQEIRVVPVRVCSLASCFFDLVFYRHGIVDNLVHLLGVFCPTTWEHGLVENLPLSLVLWTNVAALIILCRSSVKCVGL